MRFVTLNSTITRRLIAILLLAAAAAPVLTARPKIDVLVMKNGDRITCEIKKLELGQLFINTSYTIGQIPVNWAKVERIESTQFFKVEMGKGERYTGTIKLVSESEEEQKEFQIKNEDQIDRVPQKQVVLIDQLERSWTSNLSASIDAGFGYTKNNATSNLDMNANLDYKTGRRRITNKYSGTVLRQTTGANTNRHNLTSVVLNELRGSYFMGSFVDLLKSEEQQLDLRTTLGGGIGRYFKHSNRTSLSVMGGAVFAREKFLEDSDRGDEAHSNAEGLIVASFAFYKFDSSEIRATTSIFPSFTVSGRVRMNNDISLKLDLWGDLYWNISMWQNYDSKPPPGVSTQDYGLSTTFGYSF